MNTTENHEFEDEGLSDERASISAVPGEWTEDTTLRQETMGAVGAVGATGVLGAALPGSGTYAGGAALLGLTVPSERGRDSDGVLAERAEVALAEEPRLSMEVAAGIHIDTAFGVLELSGKVPDEADREIAEKAVSRLPGVSAVENKLRVSKDS